MIVTKNQGLLGQFEYKHALDDIKGTFNFLSCDHGFVIETNALFLGVLC